MAIYQKTTEHDVAGGEMIELLTVLLVSLGGALIVEIVEYSKKPKVRHLHKWGHTLNGNLLECMSCGLRSMS